MGSDAKLFMGIGFVLVIFGVSLKHCETSKAEQFEKMNCQETGLYHKNRAGYLKPVYRCNP